MSVRVSGDNSSKQLGLGDTTDRKTFTTQSGTSFAHLVTGSLSCLGIKKDGTLWYWGTVTGYGSATSPTQIESGTTWASVAAGGASFYVIKTDGTLWVLGYNGSGQLGLGDTTDRASLTQVGSGTNWHFVAGGSNHALAIKTDGTLWATGYNGGGRLALGDTSDRTTWTQVGSGTTWESVSCGFAHTLATKTDGTLWAAGENSYYQLGLNDTTQRTSFVQVGSGTTWDKIDAATGGYSSYGIRDDGTLWAWGRNSNGQLGLGDTTTRQVPTQVGSATNWSDVAGGLNHVLALAGGTVYAAGKNSVDGELGLGDFTQRTSLTASAITDATGVQAGDVFSVVWIAAEPDPVGDADGAISFVVSYPSGDADGPIIFVVSDPAGSVDGVISLEVTATGDAEAAIRLGVVDTRSTSLWSATVTLGGTDVSDKVVGVIQVDAEEGAARVASFAIRPAAGVITPTARTGSAVTLDLVRIINATEVPVRVFTGVVDVATYDPVSKLVSFDCTDDLQNRVAALSTAEIDTVVGGLYHVGAQGQVDEHWDYAQARLESVAGSLDAGALGQIRVSLWDGLTVFDTFDAADILDESPAIELPRRTEIVNRVDISYEYRYYRCRERHAHLSWSKSQFGTDALASAYQYPTRDTIDSALNGLGWKRISTTWGPSPTKVIYGGKGFWVDTSGKIANVTAHLAQRHAQNVTEAYTLTVSAPASVASNGELAKPLRGRLATQWNPDEWEADFTVTTPDASSADVDYAGDEVRAESDAAINALLAMAQVQILASHRQARVSWSVACLPEIDLTDAAGINAAGIAASGKVARLVHTLDPDAGTATTQITIALSGIAASGLVTPTTLEPPEPPDLDYTTGNDEWERRIPATINHLGAVTWATYSDNFMGYLVNAPEEFDITDGKTVERVENTYYVAWAELPITGFRLRMPGVNDTHRNPVTISALAEYDIEIPEDTLTLTV